MPVIVSQVKMGDAQVKGPAKNLPLFFQGLFQAEILPEAQGNRREEHSAPAAAAVFHGVVPVFCCCIHIVYLLSWNFIERR